MRSIGFVRNAPEEHLTVPEAHLIQKNCAWGALNCVWGVLILKESTLGRIKLRLRRIEFVRNAFEEHLIVTKAHLIWNSCTWGASNCARGALIPKGKLTRHITLCQAHVTHYHHHLTTATIITTTIIPQPLHHHCLPPPPLLQWLHRLFNHTSTLPSSFHIHFHFATTTTTLPHQHRFASNNHYPLP